MYKGKNKNNLLIFVNLSIFFFISFIWIIENTKLFFDNDKYLNPLIINKSLNFNLTENNYEKFIKILNYKKTNINIPDRNNITLLMKAIILHSNQKYLKELIKRSNKKFINKNGETPIHISILYDNYKAFELLIKNGFLISKYHDISLEELINNKNYKNKRKFLIILKSINTK